MNRKAFLQRLGGVLISLPLLSIIGCSSSDDDASTPPTETNPSGNCNNGATGTISSNHGHSLVVSVADVQSGAEKTYTIQGSSGHDHSVTLTAANFTALGNGQSLGVTSTAGGGHTHSVTVICA
ncbi:MAG: hypothetical protein COA88_03200 [Kordia sp.]|nr:MAG: hypothetical protein COA88_03200 [Kordia sp.]